MSNSLKQAAAEALGKPSPMVETQEDCGCAIGPISLLDQIRSERSRVSKNLRDRIRQLDQAEALLLESEAETILQRVQNMLWGGEPL